MKNGIEVKIMPQLRPCKAWEEYTGLFHCWEQSSDVKGIVELEDGCIIKVPAEKIRFLDNLMDDIDMTDRLLQKINLENLDSVF